MFDKFKSNTVYTVSVQEAVTTFVGCYRFYFGVLLPEILAFLRFIDADTDETVTCEDLHESIKSTYHLRAFVVQKQKKLFCVIKYSYHTKPLSEPDFYNHNHKP